MITLTLRREGTPVLWEFADETITIGRSPENHLVIRDRRVSRVHARIERGRNGAQLVDLESANGTRLNGRKIGTIPLNVGDTLEFGASRWGVLRVEAGALPTASRGETRTALHRARRPFRKGRPRFVTV